MSLRAGWIRCSAAVEWTSVQVVVQLLHRRTIADTDCNALVPKRSGAAMAGGRGPYGGPLRASRVGNDDAAAEANQVLFFNAREGYRVSHPVAGGDNCLDLVIDEQLLRELTPRAYLRPGATFAFREQRLRIDPRAQASVMLLRHTLRSPTPSPQYIFVAGDDEEAIVQQLEAWEKRFPRSAAIPLAMGLKLYNIESPKAKPWLLKAAALQPGNVKVWVMLHLDAERWG